MNLIIILFVIGLIWKAFVLVILLWILQNSMIQTFVVPIFRFFDRIPLRQVLDGVFSFLFMRDDAFIPHIPSRSFIKL